MRLHVFVFSMILLLGFSAWSDAAIRSAGIVHKFPKLVDQNPNAPELVERDNYYSPKYLEIEVRPGNAILLTNLGGNIHGLIIPRFKSQTILKPGEETRIPVPEKAAGLYEFYCPFHPGMRGTIEVLPAQS